LVFDVPEKQAKRTAKATLLMTGSASFVFWGNLVFWSCKPANAGLHSGVQTCVLVCKVQTCGKCKEVQGGKKKLENHTAEGGRRVRNHCSGEQGISKQEKWPQLGASELKISVQTQKEHGRPSRHQIGCLMLLTFPRPLTRICVSRYSST
jgi:hypothetical protein